MKKMLLTLLGVVSMISAIAQSTYNNSDQILLLNHTLKLQKGSVEDLAYTPEEVVNGKIYRIVQSKDLKVNQNYDGLYTIEYLPKNAYIASIEIDKIEEAKGTIRLYGASVSYFHPSYKLSKKLFNNEIPDWAWVDDHSIKVWLTHYGDLNHNEVLNTIIDSYTVIENNSKENLIAIEVSPDKINELTSLPYIQHVQEMEEPGKPENFRARTSHRVNYLQADYAGAPGYDGSGIVIGLGDDGAIDEHLDFTGRLTLSSSASTGDHGDHVAGTIFGAGNLNPDGAGMAPGADMFYQRYSGNPNSSTGNLGSADFNYINHNVRITNSSYSNGCNAGYTNFTRSMDQDAIDNPNLIHVFSAGNNGNSACSGSNNYGGGSRWGNVTGGHKIAKNVIATANLTFNDGVASSSSRGPASDGRIKPDLGAVGSNVYSTTDLPLPNSYTQKSGTSMASPGVAGTLATLYEAFKDIHNKEPKGGLLKSITMNACDDLGDAGPDFINGYGRLNARKALEIIKNSQFIIDTIGSTQKSFQIPMPSTGTVKEVKVMLYWPDAPASTSASRALVNDLDLEIVHSGTTYQPWVLDPTPNSVTLGNPAVQARDSLNNIEQITIQNPGSGALTVNVDPFNIPTSSQEFYIIYYFEMDEIVVTHPAGGEGFSPGTFEYVRWDAPAGTSPFTIEYSVDSGATWNTLSTTVHQDARMYLWSNVPSNYTDKALMKISRGNISSSSPGVFNILGQAKNLQVTSSCPDSLQLVWDSVPGATSYIVYTMGSKYMDSIAVSNTHSVIIPKNNLNQDTWYSVAARLNNGVAKRSIAIQKPLGLINCVITKDIEISNVVSPAAAPAQGAYTDCFTNGTLPVVIELTNGGTDTVFGLSISYTFNNGSVMQESIPDTINPSATYTHTFTSGINLAVGNNDFKVWINYAADQNPYNDTVANILNLITGTNQTIAVFQDFESFASCGTLNDCGATICPLGNGWINAENGTADDIDWRVDASGTSSSNTGPSLDHNPGTNGGKYLYLEASAGCDSSVAILLSPCILLDTSIAQTAQAEFWYHMYGVDMGKLNVDLLIGDSIIQNIIPPIVGNQGNNWIKATINLNQYMGMSVAIRLRGKTGNGYRSDIAIDNFGIFDQSVAAPSANFSISDTSACTTAPVVFTDLSSNSTANYSWNFGSGATPATATGVGPHSVTYASNGFKAVSLSASNAGGVDVKKYTVSVSSAAVSNFSHTVNAMTAFFQNQSQNIPLSYAWDFGDGQTSTSSSPQNTYANQGVYYVTLTTNNSCGSSVFGDTVYIGTNVGITEHSLDNISVYPNPTAGLFTVRLPHYLNGNTNITVSELSGKLIFDRDVNLTKDRNFTFDIHKLPSGVYLISVNTENGIKHLKLIKEN